MTDLGQVAGQLGGAGDDVVAAIKKAVVAKVEGQATKGATGMAIYFPPQQGGSSEKYTKVDADDCHD